jgi:hypothetical protein
MEPCGKSLMQPITYPRYPTRIDRLEDHYPRVANQLHDAGVEEVQTILESQRDGAFLKTLRFVAMGLCR